MLSVISEFYFAIAIDYNGVNVKGNFYTEEDSAL